MADTWNMQDVAETLPADNTAQEQHAGAAPENPKVTPAGWSAPTSYDYSAMVTTAETTNFDGNCRIYEFADEEGEVGPAFPELELELFGKPEDRGGVMGNHFEK